jgi:NAD(P)-dependent dehydrogenase (short-subunit alcohol dehydrogenase family)
MTGRLAGQVAVVTGASRGLGRATARAALGPITVLVNNAAFTAPGRPPVPGVPARPASETTPGAGTSTAAAPNAEWPGFRPFTDIAAALG